MPKETTPSGVVEVCPDCDIADCFHIRERRASQAASHSAPVESKACASVGVEPVKCGIRYVGGFHSTWACDVCGHRDMHDAHPGCQRPALAYPAPEPAVTERASK